MPSMSRYADGHDGHLISHDRRLSCPGPLPACLGTTWTLHPCVRLPLGVRGAYCLHPKRRLNCSMWCPERLGEELRTIHSIARSRLYSERVHGIPAYTLQPARPCRAGFSAPLTLPHLLGTTQDKGSNHHSPVSSELFSHTRSGDCSRPGVVPSMSSRHTTTEGSRGLQGVGNPHKIGDASLIGPWRQRATLSMQPMT